MTSGIEESIKEENSELWTIASSNKHFIPDFSRTVETNGRWSRTENSLWSNLHRELSNVSVRANVLKVLNSPATSYASIDVTEIKDFVNSFPTLLWVMLLGSTATKNNVLKLLIASSRLDFLEEGINLQRSEIMSNDTPLVDIDRTVKLLTKKIHPTTPKNSFLKELRDVETAQQLFDYLQGKSSQVKKWDITQLIRRVGHHSTHGEVFYALVGGIKLTPKEWLRFWELDVSIYNSMSNPFTYYFEYLFKPEDADPDNVTTLLSIMARSYPSTLYYILANDKISSMSIFLYSTEVVDILSNIRPKELLSRFDTRRWKPLIDSKSALLRVIQLGIIDNYAKAYRLAVDLTLSEFVEMDGTITSAFVEVATNSNTKEFFVEAVKRLSEELFDYVMSRSNIKDSSRLSAKEINLREREASLLVNAGGLIDGEAIRGMYTVIPTVAEILLTATLDESLSDEPPDITPIIAHGDWRTLALVLENGYYQRADVMKEISVWPKQSKVWKSMNTVVEKYSHDY